MKRVCVRGMSPNSADVCYVGRASGGWAASPLGNPFVIGKDGTREEVIEKYRRWLWTRLRGQDRDVVGALRSLTEDSTLGCWCQEDEACHADGVMKAWAWLRSQDEYAVIVDYQVAHVFPSSKEAWDWVDKEYPPGPAWMRRVPEHVFVVRRAEAERFLERILAKMRVTS